ncbi:MAG: aconitate hydratase AcnA [Candidatus Omnitrophota bacterium]
MTGINISRIKKTLKTQKGNVTILSLPTFDKLTGGRVGPLPYSIKILLEGVLRLYDQSQADESMIRSVLNWAPQMKSAGTIAFKPGRVILQDFTGVPCLVDLAAMRSAMKKMGKDPKKINPQIPCDLIIDHSMQVDYFKTKTAFKRNLAEEYKRNKERYQFLKWGQKAFKNFRIFPPSSGIIHQINLEYLAQGIFLKKVGNKIIAFPDTVIGTDSHTTMINGLGIVGWGAGGIEAEAVMLGEPIMMNLPEVVGFKLTGAPKNGVMATDIALTVTQILRKKGVVGKFVEFYGEGIKCLSLSQRAMLSNMAPEYGATMGLFPVDQETLNYYHSTGRSKAQVDLIERYYKEQDLFYDIARKTKYSDKIELDLGAVEVSLAGPRKPHERIWLGDMPAHCNRFIKDHKKEAKIGKSTVKNGFVSIASITSCTNTSDPSVLIAAGLLAKKAAGRGLKAKEYVKTSFIPGSRVVEVYLKKNNLLKYFEKLGFNIVGYGCATCIGNSGPLADNVVKAIKNHNLLAASVLSGNRNFEGRIHPLVKANYLASPALVVAYAIAGRMGIDFLTEPLGQDKGKRDVDLKDIWPTQKEIDRLIPASLLPSVYKKKYKNIEKGDAHWRKIKVKSSDLYAWNPKSTYIQEPPFFEKDSLKKQKREAVINARALVVLGDFVTTDHISPAGAIKEDSPAGLYLKKLKIKPKDFNTYGSRRGNDRVMTRGTFANIRLRNLLTPQKEGSWTKHFPSYKEMTIFDAAQEYKKENISLIVIAGKEYGTGSSRDWAAKGTALLGVTIVLAQSFERIHKSNLIGMGILPLQFKDEDSKESLGLKGDEMFDFCGLSDQMKPNQDISVVAKSKSGFEKKFITKVRLDTKTEVDYYQNGGILSFIVKKLFS